MLWNYQHLSVSDCFLNTFIHSPRSKEDNKPAFKVPLWNVPVMTSEYKRKYMLEIVQRFNFRTHDCKGSTLDTKSLRPILNFVFINSTGALRKNVAHPYMKNVYYGYFDIKVCKSAIPTLR